MTVIFHCGSSSIRQTETNREIWSLHCWSTCQSRKPKRCGVCIYMYSCIHMRAKSLQLCLTLCNPMDCSPPGPFVHGILQERILELVVIPFSRRSSQPRDQIRVFFIAGGFFTAWATTAAQKQKKYLQNRKTFHRLREWTYGCQQGGIGGRVVRDF